MKTSLVNGRDSTTGDGEWVVAPEIGMEDCALARNGLAYPYTDMDVEHDRNDEEDDNPISSKALRGVGMRGQGARALCG